jgi:CheY-like chemotaxis protein
MAHQTLPAEALLARIRCEYREMPGLQLTFAQARLLWQIDPATCSAVLQALVDEGFLVGRPDGRFVAEPTDRMRGQAARSRPEPETTVGGRVIDARDHGSIRSPRDIPRVPTVLLVESDSDAHEMYAEYLRIVGLHTVVIDDTGDALALAHTADVIVTGIRVHGPFDGLELVRRLRQSNGTRDTPIIVLTACAFESDQQRALAAGCDAFLPKPCLPDRVYSEIRAVLGRCRALEDSTGAWLTEHGKRRAF